MRASSLEELLNRAADPAQFDRWREQGRVAGWCTSPVRLSGQTRLIESSTGEVVRGFSSREEPDGVLLKACGQRRSTVCPSCAAVYRSDAFQLIVAGLKGGKGAPAEVASAPAVFVTLTAPSFGLIHSRREKGGQPRICRPRASGECPHGRPLSCERIHRADDSALGTPLCLDCYDYEGVVLWNAHVTELWRRTTIALRRNLFAARTAGAVRLSYAKVVEFQQRGVVHLHVVVRIDAGADRSQRTDAEAARAAMFRVAGSVAVPYPSGYAGAARWGRQLDVRTIGDAAPIEGVAAYIAKYATKSTDSMGKLDHRLRRDQLASLDLPDHLRRLVITALALDEDPRLGHLRLGAWAHSLGFRGHWLTKSRGYSTTFGALRTARSSWAATQHGEQTPTDDEAHSVKEWKYVGRGWTNSGDAILAASAANDLAAAREHARAARREEYEYGKASAHT